MSDHTRTDRDYCDTCDEEYPECGSEPHECEVEARAAWADHRRKARMEDGE